MQEVTRENFQLIKVKLPTNGGLDCTYNVIEEVDGEFFSTKQRREATQDVHIDLADVFTELKPIIASVFGLDFPVSLSSNPEFKAEDNQIDVLKSIYESTIESIVPTEFKVSGTGENIGVVITAESLLDGARVLRTDKLFTKHDTELSSQIAVLAEAMEAEVYEYIFKDKYGTAEDVSECFK